MYVCMYNNKTFKVALYFVRRRFVSGYVMQSLMSFREAHI